ncbi:MAG: DUF1614 domain-containing protein [Firmicutes bacterium]|nr:DUF1614 domain-containing protein [Bacillota bacterium]
MTGVVLLIGVSILIFLGLAHRVLDRLYLSDRGGLLLIGALIAGSFIDVPIWRNPLVTLNVGGAIIPLLLSIYVLSKAGSGKEVTRSVIGIIITVGVLYGVSKLYSFDTARGLIEPQYLWAVIAAVIAYLAGRSRRLAFIIATLGLLALDVAHIIEVGLGGFNAPTRIGGAGAFDTIVVAGILAVLLAELIGESREALQGGPVREGHAASLNRALDHPEGTGREDERK